MPSSAKHKSNKKRRLNPIDLFVCLFFSLDIEDHGIIEAEWETSAITELDISSTELSENCLLNLFTRLPKLSYLAVPNCDGFTDQVDKQS